MAAQVTVVGGNDAAALGGTRLTTEPFGALAAMPGITRSALLSLGTGLASTAQTSGRCAVKL